MAYQYETREVAHGNRFGFFAKISQNESTGAIEFGTPYSFTGLRATNFETSQESNPYYADNVEHVRLQGAKTTEGSITTYQIRREFLLNHLGKKLTNSTPPALLDTGRNTNFLWAYAETVTNEFGDEVDEYHIWVNVKASAPTGETATDEDSVEPKEIEIPLTASPNNGILDSDGKAVTEIVWRDDKNGTVKALIDDLFGTTPAKTLSELIATAIGEPEEAMQTISLTITEDNTVAEIKAYLDSEGISYPANATKSELLSLIPGDAQ